MVPSISRNAFSRFSSSVDEAFPPIYCVHYDGIYLQPVTPPGGAPSSNGSSSASNGWKSFRYIVQPRVVKRRFKEFINLESRLEANSKLGPLVRDQQLERPTTWLMESTGDPTVEARRAFLERWVAALCDRPSLATSQELRKGKSPHIERPLNCPHPLLQN